MNPSNRKDLKDSGTAVEQDHEKFDEVLARDCEALLEHRVTGMAWPGGDSRDTVKIFLSDGSEAFVSRRGRTARAENERRVLSTLSPCNVNVPQLLASDSRRLLIQQSIPGHRLTEALHDRPDNEIESWLDDALGSLAKIHVAGSAHGLDEKMQALGNSDNWLHGLLARPNIIGDFFDVEAPAFDKEGLMTLLAARKPRFVKWDARPGNAIARPDGAVFWIDWEHSGARNRLDDMVWLLADEWIPERPAIERALLDRHIESYRDDLSAAEAQNYFYAMGVFHLCIRMGLIFRYKKDGKWWSFQKCLAGDKVGVTRRNLRRICMRGERWAKKTVETRSLSGWFARMKTLAE